MQRRSQTWLRDILKHSQYILEDTNGHTLEDFFANRQLRQLVERSLTIIGIAAIRIQKHDPLLAKQIPDVQRVVGMRNRLAHGYDADLDEVVLWETVTMSVPELIEAIDRLIDHDPS